MAEIDSLEISIQGKMASAWQSIDALTKKLGKVPAALNNISKTPVKIDFSSKSVDSTRLKYSLEKAFQNTKIDTSKMADNLSKSFGVSAKKASEDIRGQFSDLVESVMNDSSVGSSNKAIDSIVDSIVKNGKIARADFSDSMQGLRQEYEEFYDYFKQHKIYVSDFLKSDIGKTEFNDLLERNLSNITREKGKGIKLDGNWSELSERFPGIIPKDTINAAEQVLQILQEIEIARKNIKPIPIQNLIGSDYETVVEKIKQNVEDTLESSLKNIFDNADKLYDKSATGMNIPVQINEDVITTQIQSAIRKASKIEYEPLKIDFNIDTKKLKSDLTSKLKGLDLSELSNALSQLKNISIDTKSITEMSNAISILGRKSATAGIENIPTLTKAVKDMLSAFSEVPKIDSSIVQMTQSLAELAKNGKTLSSAAKDIANASSESAASMQQSTNSIVKDLEYFKKEIQEIDSLAEASGGKYDPRLLSWLSITLGELKSKYPEAEDLIESYEALKERIKGFEDRTPDFRPNIGLDFWENIKVSDIKVPQNGENTFDVIKKKAEGASSQTQKLSEYLNHLPTPIIKEDNLEKLDNLLIKLKRDLDILRADLYRDLDFGRISDSIDDKKYVDYQKKIALLEKTIVAVKERMKELGGESEASSNYVGLLESAIIGLKKALHGIPQLGGLIATGAINAGTYAFKKLASVAKDAAKKILKLGKNIVLLPFSAFTKLSSGILKATTAMGRLTGQSKKSGKSLKKSFTTFLKYALGIRSIYVLFNKLRSGIAEGFKNLAQYSERVNQSISMLRNSMTQTKNSFAAAASPILNAFAPALNQVIQLCIRATNYINQLLSALTGNDTWIRAKELTDDYAESIKDAAKEAKNGIRQFDELKVITTPNDGGKGSSETKPGDMFETLPIESSIANLAEKMKELVKNQDWEGIGAFIASGINSGLANLYDALNWENAKDKIQPFIDGITGIFNSFNINVDWTLVGSTIGTGINTIVNSLNGMFDGVDWKTLGSSLADSVLGLVDEVKWEDFGKLLTQKLVATIKTLNGFVEEMSKVGKDGLTGWEKLGTSIGEAINGAVEKIPWETIGETFAGLFNGIFSVFGSIATTVDSYKIGEKISEAIKTGLQGINWKDIKKNVNTIAEKLADFLNGLLDPDTMYEVGKTIAETLNTAIGAVFTFFNGLYINNLGESIAGGINGFIDWFDLPGLVKTLDKVVNVIFQALVEAVKKIHWDEALSKIGESLKEISIPTITFAIGLITFKYLGKALTSAVLGMALKAFAGLGTTGLVIGGIALAVGIATITLPKLEEKIQELKSDVRQKIEEALPDNAEDDTFWQRIQRTFFGIGKNKTEGGHTHTSGGANFGDGITNGSSGVLVETGTEIAKFVEESSKTLSDFGNNMSTVFNEVGGYSKVALNDTSGNLLGIAKGFENTISSIKTTIKNNKINTFPEVNWENSKTVGETKSKEIGNKMLTALKTVVKDGKESTSLALSGMIKGAVGIAKANEDLMKSVASIGTKVTSKIGSSIKENKTALSSSISSSLQAALSIAKKDSGLLTSAANIGTEIGNKIGNSMKNAFSGFSVSANVKSPGSNGNKNMVTFYASGGFPQSYSLFAAGENSVPEILGTVGGKTAVAGGAEITGIREAIAIAAHDEVTLLREQNKLLQLLLAKETGITQNDIGRAAQRYAEDHLARTGRPAYAM